MRKWIQVRKIQNNGVISTVTFGQSLGSRAEEVGKTAGLDTDLLRRWLLTVVCIVYSDIFTSFNPTYVSSILYTLTLEHENATNIK